MEIRKYRPSNGSEGCWFEDKFCGQCKHQNPDPDKKPQCDISLHAFMFDLSDKEYPLEWQYDKDGKPTCTAFINWNWDDDSDGNAPPENPDSDDPNQLMLFSITDDILKPEKQKVEINNN